MQQQHEEYKIRGAPKDEVPKSPLLRRMNDKQQEKTGTHPASHPSASLTHTPVKEFTPEDHEEKEGMLHHTTTAHKVALITGASSGIGKATAVLLASNNYNLVLVARKKEGLNELKEELSKYNIHALVRECDVTKAAQVHETIAHVTKEFGRLDVLVNCAGIGIYGTLEEMRLEDVNAQMVTNYFGTVLFIKESLPLLKESHGTIVNVASMAGLVGVPHLSAYSATKHAVVGLSEGLRYELDGTGVKVCCICPGKVHTNFFQHQSFDSVAWAHDNSGIQPGDVARVIHKAIHERKLLYTVPRNLRFQLLLGRLLPESWTKRRLKRD
jgi:short-subunit dehydrogenase